MSALPSAPNSLSINQVAQEYGGDTPHALSEYYGDGDNVLDGAQGDGGAIPESGAISIGDFFGGRDRVVINLTIGSNTQSYQISQQRGGTYEAGFTDIVLTNNAQVGSTAVGTAGIFTGSAPNYASGDTLKIVNAGHIRGRGGNGGAGANNAGQGVGAGQIAGDAKLPHVINFVKNIMEIEESVVVFCHHKVIHKLLHESLQEFSPVSIIGGQSDDTRQDQIDKFQKGESKLMIAGIRAGNVGINLTRAKYVIFAELDWSPAIHRQAEDRLHRIGQKNTVFAYYLIGNGTLDDHVASILVDKSYEIDAIMDETVDTYENKDKAALILAQIQDKIHSK